MNSRFVIAIGYSEGGLEPLLSFFDHVPHDHATYIILRHIPVGQRSELCDILQKHSKLAIMEAEDGMHMNNDVIYTLPSGSYLTLQNDKLYLQPRLQESGNYNFAINVFLESLAQAKGVRSIAVILSGSGFDGAVGVTKIRKAGGMVIAQLPGSCTHPQMPLNAIKTKAVNYILPPHEIPGIVVHHISFLLNKEPAK